jgi:predicted ATPase/tetratricopeptide (TPR) repeat protein
VTPATDELPVHRVGRYHLVRLLGRGGMGEVWEAAERGPGHERRVALKWMPEVKDGVVREARLGGLLRHPNIVRVHELGVFEGRWFCVMDLVSGGSLHRRGPLPPRAVIEVGLQVCSALAYAHAAVGLVHLDLKPENLLLEGATVKVADLGLARARGYRHDGRIWGTRSFMSPEQARGDVVDARSDLYSLGAVLLELATGRAAESTTMDLDFTSVDAPDTHLDWLEPVLARCLDPDPGGRFSSAATMAVALEALAIDGPGLAEWLGVAEPAAPTRFDHNLGGELDAFVGRREELSSLLDQLARPGAVVVKGPAGIGKTRLARRTAAAWRHRSGGQVWFCDLTEATTERDALAVVCTVLDLAVGDATAQELTIRLGTTLAARDPVLVVLDTFDRLATQGTLVDDLRRAAPDARFLVTTRVRAGQAGGASELELGSLTPADACALLVTRAAAMGWDLAPDRALDQLAARLEHVPLALELAAPHLGPLGAGGVLAALDRPLELLRGVGDERNATLRDTLDWSWETLSEPERGALSQLSVFVGGAPIDAVEAVVVIEGEATLDLVRTLADRSLLRVDGPRVRLYDSVRVYGEERRTDAAAEVRHGAWCATLDPRRVGPVTGAVHRRLLSELDNLLAACRRAVNRGDGAVATAACRAACAVLDAHGPPEQTAALCEGVLRLGEEALSSTARSSLHVLAGRAHALAGHRDAALRHLEANVDAASADPAEAARAQHNLGTTLATFDENARALSAYVDSASRFERLAMVCEAARASASAAIMWTRMGDYAKAANRLRAALDVFRAHSDRVYEAIALNALGVVATRLRRPDQAVEWYSAALAIERETGNRRREVMVLSNLGDALTTSDRPVEARRHLEEAQTLAEGMQNHANDALVLENLAACDLHDGAPTRAIARLEAALQRRHGAAAASVCAGLLARACVVSGDLDRAARAIERAEPGAEQDESAHRLLAFAKAELAWARGDLDEAVRRFRDLADSPALDETSRLEARVGLAELGIPPEGDAGSAELLAQCEALPTESFALRCRGLVAMARGDEEGQALLVSARARADRLGQRPLGWKLGLLEARWWRRQGRAERAEVIEDAIRTALRTAGYHPDSPLMYLLERDQPRCSR